MTREELKAHCKKEIEMCEFWAHGKDEELDNSKIYQEHKLILELLEQEPRWIPTSERLPEESGEYLVTICYNLFFKAEPIKEVRRNFFSKLSKKWLYKDEGDEITAWMPLPKSYEEVEE